MEDAYHLYLVGVSMFAVLVVPIIVGLIAVLRDR